MIPTDIESTEIDLVLCVNMVLLQSSKEVTVLLIFETIVWNWILKTNILPKYIGSKFQS